MARNLLSLVGLISIALSLSLSVGCRSFTYDIVRPSCLEEDSSYKWCMEDRIGSDAYVGVPLWEPCPEGYIPYSAEIEFGCLEELIHYEEELEIRVKHCTPTTEIKDER